MKRALLRALVLWLCIAALAIGEVSIIGGMRGLSSEVVDTRIDLFFMKQMPSWDAVAPQSGPLTGA